MRDKTRIEAIQAVMDGRIGKEESGRVLGRSIRQVNRMLKRLREKGLEGLIHGNRGRRSPRRIPEGVRAKILKLFRERYEGINDTHLREILFREEKIQIGRETLRSLLRGSGLKAKRKRRSPKYRSRRERKEAFGMMLQIDASRHDWLEGRGPWMTLVGAKDDATGYVWARFVDSENSWAYLELVEQIALFQGLPLSLYSDRHSIFHVLREPTVIEQLNNTRPLTQFGRAMEELGIRLIKAYSPQAKGRIERNWGIFQDRLVVEMRLADAKTQEEANEVLVTFLKDYNPRFTVEPKKSESVFRKAPSLTQLQRILCLKEKRTVNKDHTVSFEGLILQIPPSKKFRSLAKRNVEVLQFKEGSVEILFQNARVARFSPEAIQRLIQLNKKGNHQLKAA